MKHMPPVQRLTCVIVCALVGAAGMVRGQDTGTTSAARLMRAGQYSDAVRVLQEQIRGKTDAQAARHYLMLGESYYMMRDYEQARTWLIKAQHYLSDADDKTIAEYRLACVAYRLGDHAAALQRIDNFCTDHPNDPRVGKLLGYRMLIVSSRGRAAQTELENLHQRIQQNLDRYDALTGMEADEILCDFYRRTGQAEKAEALYTRIVHGFGKVISERQRARQPVPASMEKTHDNAALQLGIMALERKNAAEAAKWLAVVSYDPDLKARARLLLAKVAFEKQDYKAALGYAGEMIDVVPDGPLKSDMYLVLGLSERARPDGSAGKVEEYLRKVDRQTRGFAQAQLVLGDIYREKGLGRKAMECYRNAAESPDHAAGALLGMACIAVEEAGRETAEPRATELNREAARLLGQLMERYPLSPQAREARPIIDALAARGVDVGAARSADDLVKGWLRTAAQKRGTEEGAQALVSLMRHHFKSTTDEKTGRYIKSPDYAACAEACDQLLDEKVYGSLPETVWKPLRAEALYHRGMCELASVGTAAKRPGEAAPVYMKNASAASAAQFLAKARGLVDARQLDLVKGIELGLLEALFKSDKPEDRQAAQSRFAQLEADYGTDPRFQKMALELADWYRDQGLWAEAARQYAGVAERSRDLKEDDLMRLLYTAGTLYSKAAYEAQTKPGGAGYCVYVYPKETLRLGEDALTGYGPMSKGGEVAWPNDGKNITAREALTALSKASGIPFVWSSAKGPGSVNAYLSEKRLDLPPGPVKPADALAMILDLKRFRLDYDIGLCDGAPTIPPPASDDPDAAPVRVIEILPMGSVRYAPLGRLYGSWESVHRGRAAMLYNVIQRVEQVTGMRVIWAEGLDQQAKLAFEYRQPPITGSQATCAQVLEAALEPAGLRWRIMRREAWADLYESAKDCFNKVRKINPTSRYGEKALFAVALNFYNQKEYQKMKLVLREYLKVFDRPDNEFHHEACYWVGWALEHERKYREACGYYARAAEEVVVVIRPAQGVTQTRQEAWRLLSEDSRSALAERVSGRFDDASLADVAAFIQANTRLGVRIDASAAAVGGPVKREAFKGVAAMDVLWDVLSERGLAIRVENVNPKVAEKAYFRLASVYRKDNLMEQALENCHLLLDRYPQTQRLRDTKTLMLDVYRGLRDYGKVLATLQDLKDTASDERERQRLDMEIAWIFFDMAEYARAAEAFGAGMQRTGGQEALAMRDGYARSLWRLGKLEEAQKQYEALAGADAGPLRTFAYRLTDFYLRFELGKVSEREFPEDALRYIQKYEELSDEQRSRLTAGDLAKATWVYYIQGLIDLRKQRTQQALERLAAVTNSPDETIAADAGYQIGMVHLRAGRYKEARQAFEYLLFATRSSESAVRATYALGQCLEQLGQPGGALERYRQIVQRYPLSPYVGQVKSNPLYAQGAATQP